MHVGRTLLGSILADCDTLKYVKVETYTTLTPCCYMVRRTPELLCRAVEEHKLFVKAPERTSTQKLRTTSFEECLKRADRWYSKLLYLEHAAQGKDAWKPH